MPKGNITNHKKKFFTIEEYREQARIKAKKYRENKALKEKLKEMKEC